MNKQNGRFGLVLAGGGVRGMAHVGVLHALSRMGLCPDAIVGVSMGGIIAATYALNTDWYRALCQMDTRSFPEPARPLTADWREKVRALLASEKMVREMFLGWGAGEQSQADGQALIRGLTLGKCLEQGKIPVATVAMDLVSGTRVVFDRGDATMACYASAALPGLLPPLSRDGQLLADGTYVDDAPVDVVKSLLTEYELDLVLAVDVGQLEQGADLNNGFQAMLRAVEICHHTHSRSRFQHADKVVKVTFPRQINILAFEYKRVCIAAGVRAIRNQRHELCALLQNNNTNRMKR